MRGSDDVTTAHYVIERSGVHLRNEFAYPSADWEATSTSDREDHASLLVDAPLDNI